MTYREPAPTVSPVVIRVPSRSYLLVVVLVALWTMVAISCWFAGLFSARVVWWGYAVVALLGAPALGWCATLEVDAASRSFRRSA